MRATPHLYVGSVAARLVALCLFAATPLVSALMPGAVPFERAFPTVAALGLIGCALGIYAAPRPGLRAAEAALFVVGAVAAVGWSRALLDPGALRVDALPFGTEPVWTRLSALAASGVLWEGAAAVAVGDAEAARRVRRGVALLLLLLLIDLPPLHLRVFLLAPTVAQHLGAAGVLVGLLTGAALHRGLSGAQA
mgnify:CR=1 FL=1